MAVAGSLIYDTEIDKNGFEKGIDSLKKSTNSAFSQIKNIVAALGIDRLISATFNTITNSINGAITRLDTLNNYTKVMQNLGASADDADKSLTTLSKGLDGLPTALNDAATGVQRLMASNKDVEKSTSYYLAMNDAILAGGASAEVQSAAMEQLLQIYSTGKVESDAWVSILTAMPGQLQQVAESFGYASTAVSGDFYTALQEGKISMDEFMDRMVLLDTEGTDSITSFAQQARDATGGIGTAMTNLQTRITKGVSSIIEAFDEWLASNGFGGIAEIIDNIGMKAKEVLDSIAENLPNVISTIETLTPAIIGAVTALTTYKTVLLAVQAIQFVQGIAGTVSAFLSLIPAITSAKDAMLLFNMATGLNPITVIIAAIAALVAAFIYLWNTSEDFRNFWIGLWEGIKTVFETVWNAIVTFFTETIPNAFQNFLNKLSEIGNNIKTFFTETITNIIQNFIDFWNGFVYGLKTVLVNTWNAIVTFFTKTIPQWIQNVIKWFEELPHNIGVLIGKLLGHITNFGLNVWNWITVELPQIIQSIINWFSQLPGRIWEWLQNTINNILVWGQNIWNTATTWVSNTVNSIINWFSQLPGRIWTWLTNTINNVINWGRDLANKGRESAQNLFNNIVDTIKSLPDRIKEIGRNLVEGLWNGITGAGNWLKDKISSFANGVIEGFKSTFKIHSPSARARDEVGRYIPQGIAVGIEADTDSALKAIDNMNNDIISEMNRAVAVETGSINASASVKSNNSMLNVIKATFNIDGSVNIDGQKAGRILTPFMTKTLKTGGVY